MHSIAEYRANLKTVETEQPLPLWMSVRTPFLGTSVEMNHIYVLYLGE